MHALLFYTLIILLPTQLGLHLWPDWALVLGRRVDYLSPTLFITDILVGLLFVVWAIDLWKNHAIFKIAKKIKTHTSFLIVATTFVIFAGCNIWFAQNTYVALYTWI